jgi:Nucleotidyltransferase
MEDFANFARLLEAIRPWLAHMVIVGGWAHRLHRFHPLATAQEYQPLRTRDVDLAFSPDAPLHGDLRKALRNAGFREELSGEHTPPVTHYRLGEEDAGFYAEFLTSKKGSDLRRDGQRDMTVLKAGITAQKLRHLDLLLEAPWRVRIEAEAMPITRSVDLLNSRRRLRISQTLEMSRAVNWIGSFDDFLAVDSYSLTHFSRCQTVAKIYPNGYLKVGLLRSRFLVRGCVLLRFLANLSSFQSPKCGPRKSLFCHSQCGGQGFEPPLLHQLTEFFSTPSATTLHTAHFPNPA